ncbi:hypothetical protein [Actinomycetospora sp. TBRC 11914]|uniref:hypothetical protein n=1 Tax=Actinomycetospora sp. TBRC 11914 TaxID=2729387 RepID=UPI00145D4A11|nr:hypothetical protein [Actinomycetospora sp. TBRC 11914]NMO88719.1 hypothetical protein [Actinomycetospora sp. TBRC 11914]
MKLFLTGAPVSPSRVTDVIAVTGISPVASRCSTPYAQEVPFTGLARTRAFAAVPVVSGVRGEISPRPGANPAAMSQRQHVDLDPHRPRPSGGCA